MFSDSLFSVNYFVNQPNLFFAVIGSFLLWATKVIEHYNRPNDKKMEAGKYWVHTIGTFIWYPLLALILYALYINNGDKLGAYLSFQVGLTAPAIMRAIISGASNKAASNIPIETISGQ